MERPATLDDVRAGVLTPERLNTFVFSRWVASHCSSQWLALRGLGVLGGRAHEFGVRLAVGSRPRELRTDVLWDGVRIAAFGIALVRVAAGILGTVQLPGALAVIGAAIVLVGAAAVASIMPAMRASRIDVLQAFRSD